LPTLMEANMIIVECTCQASGKRFYELIQAIGGRQSKQLGISERDEENCVCRNMALLSTFPTLFPCISVNGEVGIVR
jgi:hypothetical protein